MAQIKVIGDTLMIGTLITIDDVEKLERHNPEALELRDKDGNTYFKVAVGPSSASKYGISFSSKNPSGQLFMTAPNVVVGDHKDLSEERSLIEDRYATVLDRLNQVEKNVKAALADVAKIAERVSDAITIDGEVTEDTEAVNA